MRLYSFRWSGWADLNRRPPGPEPGALTKLGHTPERQQRQRCDRVWSIAAPPACGQWAPGQAPGPRQSRPVGPSGGDPDGREPQALLVGTRPEVTLPGAWDRRDGIGQSRSRRRWSSAGTQEFRLRGGVGSTGSRTLPGLWAGGTPAVAGHALTPSRRLRQPIWRAGAHERAHWSRPPRATPCATPYLRCR